MADGGASNMILLVTSLLICGAASGILLQSWTQTASSVGTNQEQLALDSKTKVTLSGDLAKTVFNSIDDRIDIFVQNSGSSILDENEFGAFVEGQSASVVVPTPEFLNGATSWSPGVVAKYTLQIDSGHNTGDELRLTVVVATITSGGVVGSDSVTEVIKLG